MNRTASYHIECVVFGTRMAEQKGKVCDPLRVLESHNIPTVADGPVFTLFTKDARARGRDIRVGNGGVRVALGVLVSISTRRVPSATKGESMRNMERTRLGRDQQVMLYPSVLVSITGICTESPGLSGKISSH